MLFRIHRNKTATRLFFLGIFSTALIYIVIYTINFIDYNKKSLELKQTNIKCINKICVEYSGIIECIDIVDSYIFKVSFNENFNISANNPVYSIELSSLGKKCSE